MDHEKQSTGRPLVASQQISIHRSHQAADDHAHSLVGIATTLAQGGRYGDGLIKPSLR